MNPQQGGSVSQLVNSRFRQIVKGIKYLQKDKRGIYHKYLTNHYGETPESFYGQFLCGPSCLMVKQFLDKNGLINQVVKTTPSISVNDERVTDHSFIELSDGIIIDPTIRQFIIDNNIRNLKSRYLNNIINSPPFFVGNLDHLYQYLYDINKEYKIENGKDLFHPIKMMDIWLGKKINYTDKYSLENMNKVLKHDENYTKILKLLREI